MGERLLLVVIDDSPESALALRFAARRAAHFDGRVAMLKVIAPIQFDHWVGVAERAAKEAREETKQLMDAYAEQVRQFGGHDPVYLVREGLIADELVAQIEEEPNICLLVLAAASGRNPGPLVSSIATKLVNQVQVPITVIPGNLTVEDIDLIT